MQSRNAMQGVRHDRAFGKPGFMITLAGDIRTGELQRDTGCHKGAYGKKGADHANLPSMGTAGFAVHVIVGTCAAYSIKQ